MPAGRRNWLTARGAALGVLLFQLASVPAAVAESGKSGDPEIAAAEVERRLQMKEKALLLVTEGDALAAQGRQCDAADKYLEAARLLKPGAAASADLRASAVKRLAISGVECAKELAAGGEFDKANARLDQILAADMAPDDRPALTLQKHLKDPDRHNPALTPRHAADTKKVSRLLSMAGQYVELGEYKTAEAAYNQVLAIDETNTAARRGLEGVQKLIEEYHKAARDHTRLKMLNEVDRMYETKVPALAGVKPMTGGGSSDVILTGGTVLAAKLHGLIIPRLQMSDSTMSEAVAYLMRKSIELDTAEPDERRRGVNILWNPGAGGDAAAKTVTLEMQNVSLVEALHAVCQISGTRMTIDGSVVRISLGGSGGLETRQFRVPPGFLSTSATAASTEASNADPFAAGGADDARPKLGRLDPRTFLERQGVPFPEGGRANYSPAQNLLTVTNTPENLDGIAMLVEGLTSSGQRQALITVVLLKAGETTLNELGGEFLMEAFNVGSGVYGAGGTFGNSEISGGAGSGGAFGNNTVGPIPVPFGIVRGPVTAGLRSSVELNRTQSFDDLIDITNNGLSSSSTNRSPFIASVGGVFTNPRFQALVRGLNQKKGVDLTVATSVIVKSGQRASTFSGRKFWYPTEFDPPQIPQTVVAPQPIFRDPTTGDLFTLPTSLGQPPVTPATPNSFQEKDVGSSIEVEATIGEDGYTVDLNLSLMFSEFDGFINYGTPIKAMDSPVILTDNRILQPTFSRASATAQVLVYDGQTVAVGGLTESRSSIIQDKVPIWSSIPIVGKFFTSNVQETTRTAIIYFVSVKIVNPSGERVHNNTEVVAGDASGSGDAVGATDFGSSGKSVITAP